tara:strand:- start:244 stop:804 length:561 start_codon:yes stop_codon:yes gene_type:complete
MDLMTKIEGLEKAIAEHKDFAGTYESELARAKQQLIDYNKPELTPDQFDQITEAVENAIDNFDFENADNYTFEYELDYDGRVSTSNVEFDTYDIKERICNAVYKLFAEATCPEDKEPTADQINSAIQTTAEVVFDRNEELLDSMPPAEQCESEVTAEKPSEEDMAEFNNKVEETKEKSFKKRTWFK